MCSDQAICAYYKIVFRETNKLLKVVESHFQSKYCRGREHVAIRFIEHIYPSSNQIVDAQRDPQWHFAASLDQDPPARAIPREEPARFKELQQLKYK
jgi:hypothetical protein